MAGPDAIKIFNGLGRALEQSRLDVVKKAAFRAKVAHDVELRKATPTMRLRNVGPKGAQVSIRTKASKKGHAMAEGEVSASGPVHLLERRSGGGTGGYEIIAGFKGDRNSIRQNNSGSEALTVPGKGRGFFSRVLHPGAFHASAPKAPFGKGFDRAKPLISRTIRGRNWETIEKNGRL